jgi:hypothetical protein
MKAKSKNKDAVSYRKMILDCDKQIDELRRNRPQTGEQRENSLYFESVYLELKQSMIDQLAKIE